MPVHLRLRTYLFRLVSCRMSLYRLPSRKRSLRLITVSMVHKRNCALQSSIKIPWNTWPNKQPLWAPPFLVLGDTQSRIMLIRHLAVFDKNHLGTKVPETPLIHRGSLGFSCYLTQEPSHCQGGPWQGSASLPVQTWVNMTHENLAWNQARMT